MGPHRQACRAGGSPLCEKAKQDLAEASASTASTSASFCTRRISARHDSLDVLACHRMQTREIDDLADVDLGLWEGMRGQDLEEKAPKAYREWRENPLNVQVPEGEPMMKPAEDLGWRRGAIEKLRAPDPGVESFFVRWLMD